MFKFKHHLAGTRYDFEPCTLVLDEVKIAMMKVLASTKEASMKKRVLNNIEEFDDEQSEGVSTTQCSSNMFKNKGKEKSSDDVQATLNQLYRKGIKEKLMLKLLKREILSLMMNRLF